MQLTLEGTLFPIFFKKKKRVGIESLCILTCPGGWTSSEGNQARTTLAGRMVRRRDWFTCPSKRTRPWWCHQGTPVMDSTPGAHRDWALGYRATHSPPLPPPPWLVLERTTRTTEGHLTPPSAGSWPHALEKVTNCCPLGKLVAQRRSREVMGGGAGGVTRQREGLGACKGPHCSRSPQPALRGTLSQNCRKVWRRKKKCRGREVTREQT